MTRCSLSLLIVLGLLIVPASAGDQAGSTPAPAQTADSQPWPPPGVERAGKAIQNPAVVKDVKPVYTRSAMDAGVQGSVEVEAVVEADGSVGEVRAARSLDKEHGLDEQAVKAVKAWKFRPARKDGRAVPVLVSIELTFALRPKGSPE